MHRTATSALLASAICAIMAVEAQSAPPVITSISEDGQIEWSGSLNTNARYSIQWAASLLDPWHNSFQSIHNIEAHVDTTFAAKVPLFYRVVMTTSPPPSGMVLIDAGEFAMGNSYPNEAAQPWYPGEVPVHSVLLDSFYIDRYEVSKTLWDRVYSWAIGNGYAFSSTGLAVAVDHPVHSLDWYDCVKWCNARSQMEGLTPAYYTSSTKILSVVYKTGSIDIQNTWVKWDADGYRLPTEAEWEMSARGGSKGHHYPWESYGGFFSETIDASQANFAFSGDAFEGDWMSDPYPYTTPIGYYKGTQVPAGNDMANGRGLYDMAGNLWEWCWDWFAPYSSSSQTNPKGPVSGTYRIMRGGSWDLDIDAPRCSSRGSDTPLLLGIYPDSVGFRCVRIQ
jgi:formylglycine-generating enzyme required for sulfatase activity